MWRLHLSQFAVKILYCTSYLQRFLDSQNHFMQNIFSLLSILLFTGTAAVAQNSGKVSGQVKDEQGKGISAATVTSAENRRFVACQNSHFG
jgi:hypothetical protein